MSANTIPLPRCLAFTPFGRPDLSLLRALRRTKAVAILSLTADREHSSSALSQVSAGGARYGVFLPQAVLDLELPRAVEWVVVDGPDGWQQLRAEGRRLLVQVRSIAEARVAAAAGADGLIAKGNEAGGRVGEETTFVLLQRVLDSVDLPVWAQGGIGLHGAAAVMAAGACGYVLDSQLALLRESSTPAQIAQVLRAMDGSETRVAGEHRLLARPGLPFPAPELDRAQIEARLGLDPCDGGFVALGQDGAFAAPLAERYETVAALVRGFERASRGLVRLAQRADPLALDGRFAADYRLRYPIMQGPMTRVSDTPGFARAVSDGGGLPFLALALLRGEEARDLLARSAEALAGRTWGVGILGFVPDEIRGEQLALIRAQRPPVVIVAGGNPAQARELENEGIEAYLHVPSPGLLELFLREGVRKFVFEGRECGGHVGPRASSVLWESALRVLLEFDAPAELSLVFAGGIHDARSAAMAAVFMAPLAARGARVAALMGTAYLFTREATESGTIVEAFQQAALRCDGTTLLETAPGHSTRAIETDYVRYFEQQRATMQKDGRPAQEIWAALEGLNLGRLRIASKGIAHHEAGRVEVDARTQRAEGLYMIGQVAALRSELTTVEQLHRDVTLEASALLKRCTPVRTPVDPDDSIAIVGMSCIYPGAPDLHTFFRNVLINADCVTEVTADRWSPETYYDAGNRRDSTPSKWGAFIEAQRFDPKEFGIPPLSLGSIDPVQLLMLLVSKRALADAGLSLETLDGERTSVIVGAEPSADLASAYSLRVYCRQLFGQLSPELDGLLPAFTEDSFPGILGNVIAGRVTNRLGFGGINYSVQAACASSLAALEAACKELRLGNSDVVVAGAADLHNSALDYLMFASVHALSPRGRCRSFDDSADGIVLGEGVAALVLKRLSDARRDGDRVYAVVETVAGSSDGRNLGLTAPSKQGQELALSRAYERASFTAADLGLIEAHGTGTVLGDRTELECLTEFMGSAGALPASCTLGSVKSQIGHTKSAAGLAGVIKTALAIHYGVLPPTNHISKPNAGYHPSRSPFVFRKRSAPWLSSRRRAGVSAFGFGGTNFHAVLGSVSEADPPSLRAWPYELFSFRGKDRAQALEQAAKLAAHAADHSPLTLAELAASTWESFGSGQPQIAVIAESKSDLRAKLERLASAPRSGAGIHFAPERRLEGKLAFLFPGQGSQRIQMLADIFVHFPALRRWLSRERELGERLYPGSAFGKEAEAVQQRRLSDTRNAQPALGVVELALAELLQAFGLNADMAAGHSYGELAALCHAGSVPHEVLPQISRARAEAMLGVLGSDPGTMAVVMTGAQEVEALVAGTGVVLANLNAPRQVVISGATGAVEQAEQRITAAGVQTKRIPVAAAFHSPLLAGAEQRFAAALSGIAIAVPRIPVWSNVTARCHAADAGAIGSLLAEQLVSPVRFEPQIRAMYEAGARIFVEVGPGNVLSGLVGSILENEPHCAVSVDRDGVHGIQALLHALATLSTHGVALDLSALYAGRVERLIDLARSDPPQASTADWLVDGHRARPLQGEPPANGFKPLTKCLSQSLSAAADPSASTRDGAVLQYLSSVQELIESQRQVMLTYLGGATPEVAARVVEAPAMAQAAPMLAASSAAQTPVAAANELVDPLQQLVQILSERTGYPAEMLEPNLDLEADLGIDSIKRTEILGLLAERLGLGKTMLSGSARETLGKQRTLAQLGQWLQASTTAAAADGAGAAHDQEPERATVAGEHRAAAAEAPAVPIQRFAIELGEARGSGEQIPLEGRRLVVTTDPLGVKSALVRELAKRGATVLDAVQVVGVNQPIDGVVCLDALDPCQVDPAKGVLLSVQHALTLGATTIIAATGFGGDFGLAGKLNRAGGVTGLLKSVAHERRDLRVRCVDLDCESAPGVLAQQIVAELASAGGDVEVGYRGERKYGTRLVARQRPATPELRLERDAVVLVTGGARGITAELAYELASTTGCRLELMGTTALPSAPEDEETARCADAKALRSVLARKNGHERRPSEIERRCKQILAAREVASTLQRLRGAASAVNYHRADVRDDAAVAAVIAKIYERWNRLDVVIHGAGILDDGLLEKKSSDSFARVYDTKVVGARSLLSHLRGDTRLVAFCSSISAVFGNRGQTDYAAANDYLDRLALKLNGKNGLRALSINWGPWSGVGMVTKELEEMYRRQGVGLIEPRRGAREFVDELLSGAGPQVVLMAPLSPTAEHG